MHIKENIKKIISHIGVSKDHKNKWLHDAKEGFLLACKRPSLKRWPSLRQLTYLPSVLNKKDKKILSVAVVIFIISTILFGIRFYHQHTIIQAQAGGIYTEGFVGAPQYINPIFTNPTKEIDQDLSALVFSGLMRYNDKQELVNDLSESNNLSEDKKQYTFVLRQKVNWHDNAEFTADDVVFTFETIKDPKWKSPHFNKFKDVEIEKIDDRTVKFILKNPNLNFLDYLIIGILPVHLWENVPAISATLSELNIKPIGTGPFVFSKITREKKSGTIREYELSRNTGFYRAPAFLETIRIKFFDTIPDQFSALKNNQIDGIRPLNSNEFIPAETWINKYNIHSIVIPQYTAAFFNKKNAILKDKSIREALLKSIIKSEILAIFNNNGTNIVDGPIIPDSFDFTKEIKKINFDKQKASELLDQSGFKITDGGVRKKGDAELKFTLKTTNEPTLKKVAEILQNQWAEIGVKITIEEVDISDFQKEVIKPRNFDIVLATEYVGRNNDLFSFWHSSQATEKGFNLSNTVNRDLDTLLEDSKTAVTPDERATKLRLAQDIIVSTELPALFLFNSVYPYIASSNIKGMPIFSLANFSERFNTIENWHIKTKRVWK